MGAVMCAPCCILPCCGCCAGYTSHKDDQRQDSQNAKKIERAQAHDGQKAEQRQIALEERRKGRETTTQSIRDKYNMPPSA
ncbi:hypothetical protein SARC_03592 [Sphaeroforma arctica JP610]|uniref:Uncharacterized protein n=1 Tax=Sphaeroforma arctica JP610 TaxID=667725 RepID=A0A0L0G567_9EUKA|nr:hypothetical protein SARC_03592 [Sphaeroforma arctica JP610]KNC84170.1 hypothetical protein SARC_03592 [Sphaeroforma arctica JP610]|eukprot:XP_014158072.1 hypothetical protein SARC_03592 [Sphaeroforma arctica JP610]